MFVNAEIKAVRYLWRVEVHAFYLSIYPEELPIEYLSLSLIDFKDSMIRLRGGVAIND